MVRKTTNSNLNASEATNVEPTIVTEPQTSPITANDLQRFAVGNAEVVVVETQLKLTDINMYRGLFEDKKPGIYKVDYRCPTYNMLLTVSWDGERLV